VLLPGAVPAPDRLQGGIALEEEAIAVPHGFELLLQDRVLQFAEFPVNRGL
jgi:hypothetical protein